MSFGFSAGDFIAALELIGTVINALRESGVSGTQYRALINQLYSLETALLQVKQLELEEEQRSEYIALRQSASQCQRTIDNFWKKIQKYQRHLRTGGSTSKLKDSWMKVRWAMCQQEDLARFQTDLAAHTQSINIIMATLQVNTLKNQGRKRNAEYKSMIGTIQDATFQCMAKLVEMTATITFGVIQGQEILHNTARILATNIRIFQVVCSIQNIIARIPGQVERQQPVYMIDALGRSAPFYLEFIRCKEALQAVLKINFEKVPSGPRKIDNGEYVLMEAASKRQINLSADWDACFMPGQRVEMRMTFQRQSRRLNSCPSCAYKSEIHAEEDIECVQCGITFRRIIQIEEPPTDSETEPRKKCVRDLRELAAAISNDGNCSGNLGPPRPPKTAYDEVEDVKYYRRVNVVQRQRRAVWELDITGEPTLEQLRQQTQRRAHGGFEKSYYGEEISGGSDAECLADLRDFVDVESFRYLLDMDSENFDEIEREFSRSLILNGLRDIELAIRRIQDELNNGNDEIYNISCLAHFLRGSSDTMGIYKVRDLAGEIQGIANDLSRSIEQRIHGIKQVMDRIKDDFVDAKQKLRAFYREEHEETDWCCKITNWKQLVDNFKQG